VNNLHTVCKNCIYAIYNEENKSQIGCEFDRIEKLKKNGIKVIESYDDEKEFFVLDNHACMSYREKDFLNNVSLEEAKKITRKQMSPRIAAVINVVDDNKENLKNIIKNISDQTIKFSEVIFCTNKTTKPSDIISILNELKCTFKWNIKQILDDYWLGSKSINVSVQKSKSTYFSLFDSNFNIPNKFVEEIDKAICDDLKRFIILEPIDEKGNGATFQTYAFNALRGNEEAFVEESDKKADNFIDKISFIATKQNLMHLIKKCEEICPCMIPQQ
jgi:hypothetical protein